MMESARVTQRTISSLKTHAKLFPLALFGFHIRQPLDLALAFRLALPFGGFTFAFALVWALKTGL
jgi:hypothetical protein